MTHYPHMASPGSERTGLMPVLVPRTCSQRCPSRASMASAGRTPHHASHSCHRKPYINAHLFPAPRVAHQHGQRGLPPRHACDP